jgi:hypothetical protein
MKKLTIFIVLSLLSIFIFNGCASYRAVALGNLSPEVITTSTNPQSVVIASKAFTKSDCKKYLDRDVINAGYQPVQIYIQNNSDTSYLFSPSRVSLPSARAEEVAEKVHTSTVGRATGYGAAAVFTCGLFAIPAIVDGVKSANANESLDNDFACKIAKEQILFPHSHLNMLIFVPRESFQNQFSVTLIDQKTQKPETLTSIAR